MVHSRPAHGPVTVREDTSLYLNVSVHTKSHGQLTVQSRSAHVPVTVREDICLYLKASLHTNSHVHVTGRSTKRGYLKKNICPEVNTVTVKSLPVKFLACLKQNEMRLIAVRAFGVQLYPYPWP